MDTQPTILIVEDERAMRQALRDKLTRLGYGVVEAADGEEGLNLAYAGHPDLIVLDVAMPKMDGETMLKQLRQDDWGKNVPVIVLTNLLYLQDANSKERASEYLLKSDTKLEDLVEKIKTHLGG